MVILAEVLVSALFNSSSSSRRGTNCKCKRCINNSNSSSREINSSTGAIVLVTAEVEGIVDVVGVPEETEVVVPNPDAEVVKPVAVAELVVPLVIPEARNSSHCSRSTNRDSCRGSISTHTRCSSSSRVIGEYQ